MSKYIYNDASPVNLGHFGPCTPGQIIDLQPVEVANVVNNPLYAPLPAVAALQVKIITTTFSTLLADAAKTLLCNHSTAFTVSLNTEPTFGEVVMLQDISSAGASANPVTIDPGPNTILGLEKKLATVGVSAPGSYATKPTLVFTGDGTGAAGTLHMQGVTAVPVAPGTGYAIGEVITLAGGTNSLVGKIAVASLKAVSLIVAGGGTGFHASDILTVVGGTGTATQITVDTVDGDGVILTAHISTAGAYTVLPANNVLVTGGNGTLSSFTMAYGVLTATISQAGDYTVLPASPVAQDTATSSGTGCTLTVLWGALSVAVTVPGTDYTTLTATLTGGGGAGGGTLTTAFTSTLDVLNTDGGVKYYIYGPTEWVPFTA